jgi:hypothetical protein
MPALFLRRGTVFVAPRCGQQRWGGECWAMPPKVYRSYAAECLRWAVKATDAGTRSSMRLMAIAWTDLAEQAERNQRNDVVYETPEPER